MTMATVDPKKQALVRALMERDLYEMLDVPRDADDDTLLAGIARRTDWVEETPMRHADREAEMHWLAWADRALVKDPEIRAEYDAALERKAAAEARAIESRQRVRKLHVARDQLAKREAARVVPIVEAPPKKKAATPRAKKDVEVPAGAGPAVEADIEVTEVIEVVATPDGGVQVTDVADTIEVDVTPEGVTVTEVIDVVQMTASPDGEVEVTEVIEVIQTDIAADGDGEPAA
jgi:hypothetical protein